MSLNLDLKVSERGGIMIMVLFIFLIISVLGTTIISCPIMEYKSSSYAGKEQQAQQAADGGVDWGMEKIYAELNENINLQTECLPLSLTCGHAGMILPINEGNAEVVVGRIDKVDEGGAEPNYCVYEFTSSALYEGAQRAVTVKILFIFRGLSFP